MSDDTTVTVTSDTTVAAPAPAAVAAPAPLNVAARLKAVDDAVAAIIAKIGNLPQPITADALASEDAKVTTIGQELNSLRSAFDALHTDLYGN